MKYLYDLHIHSALSPCADDDMTPLNIVANAAAKGLELIAVADHNSIKNVYAAMELGQLADITVVPAMELQTNEDIHILCLFDGYENLENFYNSISFTQLKNKPEVFGRQYVIDADDNIVCEESSLLIAAADISETDIRLLAKAHNGIAIPAHIDREAFGMRSILGGIPKGYTAVEISKKSFGDEDAGQYRVISNSDAHTLDDIGKNLCSIDLPARSARCLIDTLLQNG